MEAEAVKLVAASPAKYLDSRPSPGRSIRSRSRNRMGSGHQGSADGLQQQAVACLPTVHHASRGGREQARDLPEPLDTFLQVDLRNAKSVGTVTHGKGVCAGIARTEQHLTIFSSLFEFHPAETRSKSENRLGSFSTDPRQALVGESRDAIPEIGGESYAQNRGHLVPAVCVLPDLVPCRGDRLE